MPAWMRLPWPAPALLTWALAWAVFLGVGSFAGPWVALLSGCVLGTLASLARITLQADGHALMHQVKAWVVAHGVSMASPWRGGATDEVPTHQGSTQVVMTYVGLLRRAPEQTGFDHWLAQLQGGASIVELIESFLRSPEYNRRFEG